MGLCYMHDHDYVHRSNLSSSYAYRPVAKDRRCEVEIVLRANSLRLANKPHLLQGHAVHEECRQEFAAFWDSYMDDPLFARNIIVRSVCPQIYGMLVVKLSILLTIIGGVEQVSLENKSRNVGTSSIRHSDLWITFPTECTPSKWWCR